MKNSRSNILFHVFSILILLAAPIFSHADIHRIKYRAQECYLIIEILDDDLIHFEYGGGAPPDGDPAIESSIMICSPADSCPPAVCGGSYHGPGYFFDNQKGLLETNEIRLEIASVDLSVKIINKTKGDLHLTTVSPPDFGEPYKTLAFTRRGELDIYGLGQQFVEPGNSNIDWDGRIREGGAYGNIMVGFDYGATGNTQIPIMYAVHGATYENYAVFVDETRRLRWNFTGREQWTVTTSDDPIRFFVLTGPDLLDLRKDYMELTGRPPVPPRAMFGLWISEFGYDDWYEVGDRRKTLHEHGFPVDGFVLDLQWFGGIPSVTGRCMMGSLDFDETKFFTPAEIIKGYRERFGIGFMAIEEPYVCEMLPEFDMLRERGYLVQDADFEGEPAYMKGFWGEGGMFDYTSDACCAFVHDTKRMKLIETGIIGHWTDLGEPEVFSPRGLYAVGRHADAHNIYNLCWIRGIFRGYVRNRVNRRPFMMSRSGTAGIQRFGASMWSGDIASRLTSLAAHAANQMHMSMSGIDYYAADIGGFHRNLEGDLNEMYTQWYAYGMLFDIPGKTHVENLCNCKNNAPDRIGHLESNLANTRLRYGLIPYVYSLAHRAYLYGEPVMPPPILYYQTDNNLRNAGHEKMIGRDLLAAVVARHGVKQRDVYLPQGAWYDWHSGERLDGGTWIRNVPVYRGGIFRPPLYARAGAVIPMMHVDENTLNAFGKRRDGTTRDELIIRAFATAGRDTARESSFTLYEDDGTSIAYQDGAVRTTIISQSRNGDSITIAIGGAVGTYDGAIDYRNVTIILVGAGPVKEIVLNSSILPHLENAVDPETARAGWYEKADGSIVIKSGVRNVADEKKFVFKLDT